MKRSYSSILCLVFLVSLFSSCTIQKRVHQRGYHIAWSASKKPKKQSVEVTEKTEKSKEKIEVFEIYPSDENQYSSSNSNELVLVKEENVTITNRQDTVVPNQNSSNDEYFDKRATPNFPSQSGDLPGKGEANLALTFGILTITSPIWITLLALALVVSSQLILQTLAIVLVMGMLCLLLLIITTLALSIHFLKTHGKDPAYIRYKNRAVTGLILACIIPGILLLSMILALAMA